MNWLLKLVIIVWSTENGDNELAPRSVHVDDVRRRFALVDSSPLQASSRGECESVATGRETADKLLYRLDARGPCEWEQGKGFAALS